MYKPRYNLNSYGNGFLRVNNYKYYHKCHKNSEENDRQAWLVLTDTGFNAVFFVAVVPLLI